MSIVTFVRSAAAVVTTCLLLAGCRHRVRTFVISAGMEAGWVAVVLSDPACGDPGGSALEARIIIPPTGYACTSLRDARGYVVDHYYREMVDGSLRELALDKDIFVPAITEINDGSCHLIAKTFWYGPRDKMRGQGDPSAVIRQNRGECR